MNRSQNKRSSRRLPAWLWCFVLAVPLAAVNATPPLSRPTGEVWKRDLDGNVLYASAPDDRLIALCIETAGVASWIPEQLLEGIRYPKLDEFQFVRGVGLAGVSQHVPDWGAWGLSLAVETEIEVNGRFEDGPTYYFIVSRGPTIHRVTRSLLSAEEERGPRAIKDSWMEAPGLVKSGGKCMPPASSSGHAPGAPNNSSKPTPLRGAA